MREVAIVGVGLTKFGRRDDASYRDLGVEACIAAFEDTTNISPKDIEAFYVATGQPERHVVQSQPAALFAEYLGLDPKVAARVEMACTSSSVALRMGYIAIASGLVDTALICGVEKMGEAPPPELSVTMGIVDDKEFAACYGLTPPSVFAMIARRHIHEFGTTEEQMAKVAVKNHENATKNPCAHFQKRISVEQVLSSPVISHPLKLFDCSPITDGAAAVILASGEKAKTSTDVPIHIAGSAQVVRWNMMTSMPTITTWLPLKEASKRAYKMAKVDSKDIDVAEVHDCFTIAEIIAYEDLGFCDKGKGGNLIDEGVTEIGGKLPVNTSGGLKAKGHPIGATGAAQAAEIVKQLRGEAGKRQVDGAEIGLTHNHSGEAINQVVHIYRRK